MVYTVKQLSKIAGVSVRTLHYYDKIGLLKPSFVKSNGYRCYEEPELLRLQQILFFRELQFSLDQIMKIINSPDFDMLKALDDQRALLELKKERIEKLLSSIDNTIIELREGVKMKDEELYSSFSNEQAEEYKREVIERWGEDALRESEDRIRNWTPDDRAVIEREGKDVIAGIAAAMGNGPESDEVQSLISRYYKYINNFYDYTPDIFKNLGEMYVEDDRFAAYFRNYHKELPEFMRDAITVFVDRKQDKNPG